VRGGEPLRDLERVFERLSLRDGTFGEPLPERLADEELHDRVGPASVPSDVVDAEDVRVGERGDRFRLALEALEGRGVAGELLREELDRHFASQAWIPRAVDLAHAAGTERSEDLVGSEARAGFEGHRGEDSSGARRMFPRISIARQELYFRFSATTRSDDSTRS
jgi:hypothetical protein